MTGRGGRGRSEAAGVMLCALSLALGCAGPSFAAGPGAVSAHPAASAASAASAWTKGAAARPAGKASAAAAARLVDINSASLAQLKTLPGIGEAEAQRIVAGRPYLSKTELATAKVIPTGVYLSIRKLIFAKQKSTPKGKA